VDREAVLAAIAGDRAGSLARKCPQIKASRVPTSRADARGREPRARRASRLQPTQGERPARECRNSPYVNLIPGRTCAPSAGDRSVALAANAGSLFVNGCVDVPESRQLTRNRGWRGLAPFAARAMVRCSRPQSTLDPV
jgi:hypothetical protein